LIRRVAHLSDIHFGAENADAVIAALEDLRRAPPDLVVITGDITAAGAAHEYDRAAAWARTLPEPTLQVPGNHDAPYRGPLEILRRMAWPFRRWELRFGPADSAMAAPDLAVACVNTARGVQARLNWSKGAISRAQVDAAVAALARRGAGDLAVFACHHPLVEMIGGPMTGRVRGGESAARRLCESGVDVILTGHVHAPFAMALPYGDGRSLAVGAGTLSTRLRGAPAGFNIIEVTREAVTVVAQGWTGSGFRPWRTWSFARRLQ